VVAGSPSTGGTDYIYRSTDYGQTYGALIDSPSAVWSVIASDSTGQHIFAGQADNAYKHLYCSGDYGESWSLSDTAEALFWYSLASSADGQHVIAQGNSDVNSIIYVSSDYGQNYTRIGPIINVNYQWINAIACDSTGQYVYAAMGGEGIYKSTDYGANWTITSADILNGENYSSISVDSTGQYILAYNRALYETFLSSDYGETWILQNTPGTDQGDGGGSVIISSNSNSFYLNIQSNPGLMFLFSNGIIPISNICFPAKTPVATDQGIIDIDKINPAIHTIDNKKIVAITETTTTDKYLVCFEKNALNKNCPNKRTIMSKDHQIFYGGKMTKANKFVGVSNSVHRVKYNGEVLYNVLMENYEKICVNNLICESLHPRNVVSKLYSSCLNKTQKKNFVSALNDLLKKKTCSRSDVQKYNTLINSLDDTITNINRESLC
jgi:hypothetical protein